MKKNIKKLALGSLGVLLAAQLAGCSAAAGIKPSEAACNQFLVKMKAHQFKVAYNLLSPKCRAVTSQQQMTNYWTLIEQNRGLVQSWAQQGTQVYAGTGGSTVRLNYGLKCSKGAAAILFTCSQENNQWVILGFNVNA